MRSGPSLNSVRARLNQCAAVVVSVCGRKICDSFLNPFLSGSKINAVMIITAIRP